MRDLSRKAWFELPLNCLAMPWFQGLSVCAEPLMVFPGPLLISSANRFEDLVAIRGLVTVVPVGVPRLLYPSRFHIPKRDA